MRTPGRRRRRRSRVGAGRALLALAGAAVLAGAGGLRAQEPPRSGGGPRPAWVVAGVPDTVRILVERAAATGDVDRARVLLRAAEEEARTAADERPGDPGRRFALAVVLGLRADREGGRTRVRAAAALHDELVAILELDPEHARARHLLGRLHAGVMRMNGVVRWIATRLLGGEALEAASWEEAEGNLAFAEAVEPAVLDHHLQLANLYRDTGRPALALREVAHVLGRPASSAMDEAVRAEAAELERALLDGSR